MLIEKEVSKQYGSKCPCCGTEEDGRLYDKPGIRPTCYECSGWFGKHDSDIHPIRAFFRITEKNRFWRYLTYACTKCGCEWRTPAYPTNMVTKKKILNFSRIIWKN